MTSISNYWQFVRLEATGRLKIDPIEAARQFLQREFAEAISTLDGAEVVLQRSLLQYLQPSSAGDASRRELAVCCLRCYISHQIEHVCTQLEKKFGTRHGFTRSDLYPLVLNDDLRIPEQRSSSSYQSLALEIVNTFDPNRAGLYTWIYRQVRQHPELSAFLRERGVYLISDWAILNDTSPEQLQRILSEFYTLTQTEIEQACHLLQSYHRIYREDRLQRRQAGTLKNKEVCSPPTETQLSQIAHSLAEDALVLPAKGVLHRLQSLATQLRHYRIHVRNGTLPTPSLDQADVQLRMMELPDRRYDADADEQLEFLNFYREQFLSCLDQALERAITDRCTHLQRKSAQAVEQFLTALTLFHCQGQSMGEIACQVGLKAQYQVTRLMKLRDLRESVQQHLLLLLSDRIQAQARIYASPRRLQTLDQQIAAALEEQTSILIQQAETEAAVAKHSPLDSLFSRRLCHFLDTRRTSSC